MSETEIVRTAAAHEGIRSWSATHRGAVRAHNEDRCVNRPDLGLFVVADGAGGHDRGQTASEAVTATLEELPPGLGPSDRLKAVRDRLTACHVALRQQAEELREGATIATTVVVLLLSDGHYAALWAGDSRIYLLRGGMLSRVTKDHSLVQEWVDAGLIAAGDAERHPRANVITRAVGAGADLEIDMVTDRITARDRFLLCSDGLTKAIAEPDIARMLAADDDAPAERLVLAALTSGASDNVTAVTVEVTTTFDDAETALR